MPNRLNNDFQFLDVAREDPAKKPAYARKKQYVEIYEILPEKQAQSQSHRCLDCGNPYCEWKCPVHNYIPNWLELVSQGKIIEAAELCHETNSLPEVCAEISRENPDLEIQIVAIPRVLNLSKREADMAVTVSPPQAGRLVVQKVTDYQLHLAATKAYITAHPDLRRFEQIKQHPIIGYIPDLIFDKELDYLSEFGLKPSPSLASNSVSVQINMINQGAGLGVVHDFAMPNFPDLQFLFKKAY